MSLALYRFLSRVRPAPVASALKKALGIRRRPVETPEGRFWIDPVSNFGLALLRDRAYEPAMTRIPQVHELGKNTWLTDMAGMLWPAIEQVTAIKLAITHSIGRNAYEEINAGSANIESVRA